MRLLRLLSQNSAWQLATAIFASVLSGIAQLGATICVLEVFRSGQVVWWQFALIAALAVLIGRFSRGTVARLTAQSIVRMRRRLVRSVLHLPLLELEAIGPTRLSVAFSSDLVNVASAVRNLASLSANSAILVGCFAYIGWLSIREMLVTGSLCLITIGGAVFLRFLEKRYRHGTREAWDRVLTVFRMLLDGIKQLKVNRSLARRVLLSFEESVREHQRAAAGRSRYSELVESWIQSMFYVILGAAVFGPYGAEASLRLGFGLLIVLQIRRPLRALIADSAAFSDAQVAFERLSELGLTLTERRREPDDPQHAPALSRDWRSLDLQGVHFKYGDVNSKDGFSLGPVEMTLKRGEVVFVAGGNGSGKTTLVKILAGLYPPTGGSIQLDGTSVDEHSLHWYRKKFAVVFSDFCLFEGVADLQLDDRGSELDWLTSRLKLTRRMLTEPASHNESTPLTSGERARIALLKAVVEDRPIFVFDEWAIDQDHVYKEFFYQEFLPKLRNARKLVVVISDDERYFHTADRLLWLERGEPPVWRAPSSFAVDAGRSAQGAIGERSPLERRPARRRPPPEKRSEP
jgi:putative ATP-binding cassette transporter